MKTTGASRPIWERVQARLDELLAEWEPRTTAKQRLTESYATPVTRQRMFLANNRFRRTPR